MSEAVCRMSRGGNGRRLTYRERWERLRDGLVVSIEAEHNLGARDMAQDTLVRMDQLDRTTLVKARPVRKRKGRTR